MILLILALAVDPFCDVAADVSADVSFEPTAALPLNPAAVGSLSISQKKGEVKVERRCEGGDCRVESRAQADRLDEECASCAASTRPMRRGLIRRLFRR